MTATPAPCELGRRIQVYCETQAEARLYTFYRRHKAEGKELTWGDLWRRAACLYHALPPLDASTRPGIFIFCAEEENFILALLATWMAGAVAIPASGSLTKNAALRNEHILRSSRPDLILHDLEPKEAATFDALQTGCPLLSLHAVDFDSRPPPAPTPVAQLLQYTSGSTSAPKPVYLDPETVARGCAAMEVAFELDQDVIGISWLPLHHDMGLVGFVLGQLWMGGQTVLLKPSLFMQKPAAWLHLAHRHRATITAGPNFAFERLVATTKAQDLEGLDLSSVQTVVMGGEPVMEATVSKVLALLSPHGLRAAALAPSYGMAEVTALASTGKSPAGPAFRTGLAATPVANLGTPVAGLQARILDPETGAPCDPGSVGEIWLDGPGLGHVVPQGTNWRQVREKTPVRSGDYGCEIEGALHIVGRSSNKLLIRGENVFAEDIETIVFESQDQSAVMAVAAVATACDGTESLSVLVELADRDQAINLERLNEDLIRKVGTRAKTVMILPRFTLPRTSSGKIRRQAARLAFEAGIYDSKGIVPHV